MSELATDLLYIGLNYIFQVGIGVPAELSALASLVGFWDKSSKHAAAYITAFLLFALFSNVVGVRWYGEIEFFFAVLKFGTLMGLILFGLIADLGGVPPHREFIGGRHWKNEPWNDNFKGLGLPVNLSRFLGFWSVFTKAAFSYATTEGVAVLAGEAHNPRKTMRTAIRTVFYRVSKLSFWRERRLTPPPDRRNLHALRPRHQPQRVPALA